MSGDVRLPLAGVRVLDLSRALAGPFCTMILGDLGATVYKVEPLPHGDFIRSWGPFDRGESAYFLSTNRNKRSIALDFRHPASRDLLRDWALACDVLVENFKPGTTAAMGLDYPSLAERNARLVYASVSGFGSGGPLSHLPGFDQIAQGYSGLMTLTGTPESGPVRVGVAIGDLTAGMWCAIGVLGALRVRDATGAGQKVETSLLGSLVGLLSVQGQRYLSLKQVPQPTGNEHPVIAPYGSFRAADGEFTLAPATPDMWLALCDMLGLQALAADTRFRDNASRVARRGELKAIIEDRLKDAPREAWITRFTAAGIPAGPIHSLDEALNAPQVRAAGMIETVAHPTLGALELLADPIRMSAAPPGEASAPPPLLGQHTVEAMRALGCDDARIEALLRDKVVMQAP
jgi:crotonobetainyl-CoA:carnitine CoA-transferase CaiB-like acyl-CoA transferase